MKRLYSLVILFSITTLSYAQIASWPLTSNINGTGGPGITAHPVAFGSGYSGSLQHDFGTVGTGAACNCLHGLRVWNWRLPSGDAVNFNNARTRNRYIEFSFSVNSGAQAVTVNNFSIQANAGFSNCNAGDSPYGYIVWRVDDPDPPGAGTFAPLGWWGRPGSCGSQFFMGSTTSGITRACETHVRPGSCNSTWSVTVNPGERIRFRIYIATSHSESSWRAVFGNVVISGTNPLAVTLNSFSANCSKNGTDVTWSTVSEQNASHFDLERSRDGEVWEKVKTVEANGNSSTMKYYGVQDHVTYTSVGYYRLRQVDFDGAEEIHGPIAVNCNSNENSLVVFPNPSSGEFAVEINSNEILEGTAVVVYDISGKQLLRQDVNGKLKGTNMVYFTDNNLAPGTYLVVVESESKNSFIPVKLVIQ